MIRMLLAVAGLTLMWFFCGTGNAQPKEAVPKGVLPRSVTGHGETVDTAKKAALNKAIEEITRLMAVRNLHSFKLTEAYVNKHILIHSGHSGKDVQIDNIADPFKAWVLTFRTDTDWWKDIERRDHEAERKLRGEARQYLGVQVVLALGLLLLAGVGYIRLDEYTHRRYTTWLRIAGVAVAAVLLAGAWLTLFPG